MNESFRELTGGETASALTIEVIEGRSMVIKRQHNGVAMFEYEELCEAYLGASDFIAICRNFHTIIMKNIKSISMENRNAARRFILLV